MVRGRDVLVFSAFGFGLWLGADLGGQGRLQLELATRNQSEIAPPKAQPNGAVKALLDFGPSPAQSRLDFRPWDRPTLRVPMNGVVVGYGT